MRSVTSATAGAGVLFISHRLDEIRAIADRVIVLRDGRSVLEIPVDEADDATLVRAMVGVEINGRSERDTSTFGDVRLKVTELAGMRLAGVSFSVQAGEIFGVSGVLGSGREELGSLLFGSLRPGPDPFKSMARHCAVGMSPMRLGPVWVWYRPTGHSKGRCCA